MDGTSADMHSDAGSPPMSMPMPMAAPPMASNEDKNYDDYYQFTSPDGRLYVLSSEADYTGYRTTGEVPFNVKRIQGGPNGQTVVYGLVKDETKSLEKDPNFQGAAQRMYEGSHAGSPTAFYGQIQEGNTVYVFNNWADFAAYRQGRGRPTGYVVQNATPEGATVVYVNQASLPPDTSAHFARLHAQPMRPMKADIEVQEVDMSDFVLPPEH